jgi:hypothetical protein
MVQIGTGVGGVGVLVCVCVLVVWWGEEWVREVDVDVVWW